MKNLLKNDIEDFFMRIIINCIYEFQKMQNIILHLVIFRRNLHLQLVGFAFDYS